MADLEIVSKYTIKRYIFGEKDNELEPPPPRGSLELHIFGDGGGDGYGIVVFINWKDGSVAFKMKRIFASSRVVSTNSNLSVPRRELNAIVIASNKGVELAAELGISKDNVFFAHR